MNSPKIFIVISIALALVACGEGGSVSDSSSSESSKNGSGNSGIISNNNSGSIASNDSSSDNTTNTYNQNNNTDPIAPPPTTAGNGTFPNGIWEATGTRDVLFENPPVLGESFAGGMMITSSTLDIYEALQDDGAFNGIAPCYRPTKGLAWSSWPTALGGLDGVDFVFDGSFESGMQRRVVVNGEDKDKTYYTYVGPVTAVAATVFHEKYGIACQ